jgi:ribonucleoside-diphosphate reductase beta chain
MSFNRVTAESKRMINGKSDVNQLVPFRYPWAWQAYLTATANHWMPTEIAMNNDISQWRSQDKLSDEERVIIKRNLGFFATADSIVANNLVLAVYKHITAPEARQYLLTQAFQEAVHTHSYQHIIQSLGMDEGEVFNMYNEIPSVRDKAQWALQFTESLCDPDFKTGTVASNQRFLRDLIAFYVVMEGIFFYCGFSQILSMGRRGLMTGTCEQFNYIMRDEIEHMQFGINVINEIKKENPEIWTDKYQKNIEELITEGMNLEIAYAEDTMPEGILGLNKENMSEYLRYTTSQRFKSLGLILPDHNLSNPYKWMDEMMLLGKETNFFEKRVTDYQVGGQLKWD